MTSGRAMRIVISLLLAAVTGCLRMPAGRLEPVSAPFKLSSQEQAEVDRILQMRQEKNAELEAFSCKFTRWQYDPVFGDATKPRFVDEGEIKYAAPDRGTFKVEGERAEHWIYDGKSVFRYDREKKQVIEYRLPSDLAQELLEFGPIPLLLSHDAEQLRRRYFLRIITPDDVKDAQVWLEAYPRCQQDAAHFLRAQLILTLKDMTPFGMQIFAPNERNRTVYQFWDFQANDPSVLQADSFRAQIPFGWKQITNY